MKTTAAIVAAAALVLSGCSNDDTDSTSATSSVAVAPTSTAGATEADKAAEDHDHEDHDHEGHDHDHEGHDHEGHEDKDMPSDAEMKEFEKDLAAAEDKVGKPVEGKYISLADYEKDADSFHAGDVVMFFHAAWCPSCQAANTALNSAGIPDGITVVKVDYDNSTDLKKKHGITAQHTFVQVDQDGNQVKKWAGSLTGTDIQEQLG